MGSRCHFERSREILRPRGSAVRAADTFRLMLHFRWRGAARFLGFARNDNANPTAQLLNKLKAQIMPNSIVYRHDCQITPAQDEALRALFRVCFKREAAYLEHQRFFRELPPHRWIIFDADENVVAHIAGYDKVVGTDAGLLPVIGIAEVCVAPEYRGRGLVREMLREIHDWARAQGFDWSMLFGASGIYGSSGYEKIDNPIRALDFKTGEWSIEVADCALVHRLNNDAIWPSGTIDLRGPHF